MFVVDEDFRETVIELEERVSELEYQVEKLNNVVKWLTSVIVLVPQELMEISSRCRSASDELTRIAVEYQGLPQRIHDKYRELSRHWLEIGLTRLREDIEKSYKMLMRVVESIEELDSLVAEVLNNMIQGFINTNFVAVIEVVLAIARELNMEFKDLALVYINSLGKEMAKEVIDPNLIARYYGEEAAQEWEKIIQAK